MGNKISECKHRQNILYKNIKNIIKQRNDIDVKNNIYICESNEKDLFNLNNEIFELYNTHEENTEKKDNENKENEENKNINIEIKFKNEKEKKKNANIHKKQNDYSEKKTNRKNKEKRDDEGKNVKEIDEQTKKTNENHKKNFELDYGSFYNIEEKNNICKNNNNNKLLKKEKLLKHIEVKNEKSQKLKNTEKTENVLLKKISLNKNIISKELNYSDDESTFFNDENNNTILTKNSHMDNKELFKSTFKCIELKLLPDDDSYTGNIKSNIAEINYSNNIKIKENKNEINENLKNNKILNKFLNLLKEKKILQNILSFLNCRDLLSFQKTCSIIYIYVSDFLDYICLNIYSNFKRIYDFYFTPFNFFYKYEYLYTDKPSFRLDCILISKIKKGCIGYNNRFGYKYNYIYDKRKSSYYAYFNFNVLKKNSSRIIEIHKDISYNNGDDINVSHIINNYVCSNDYICIPINLYNFIGNVDFNSIKFISNKLSKYIIYNNQLDDQMWYNKEEYQILIKENRLITFESLLPHLKHINTIYSGIDVTVMKSTYKAIQPGKLGKKSYNLWGNYFIIEDKNDPVFTFLKREGLQHDYIYHKFYLRVGDYVVFYLIKGGNNI
ncbi:conserved Plasmodium protein, unknown function [Plasmodium relictum]|uniref:F-box domain-containing protein n=1 Tax=Plasmodium relictum TaxID=85471 RepID=A0A1J1H7P6_PLARL|nr:conserved Plasmodium protein, unknown function [Plasmodium relictum]CRH00939.1 conserved Plasmodium protein, unknown function [Plasmodium relictum]